MARSPISRAASILHGRCPRCRQGAIFTRSLLLGLPPMHQRCAVCGLKFEREEGYFLGAMYVSYMLAVPLMAALLAALWWLTAWRLEALVVASALGLIPFAPLLSVFSRVLWIHFDRAVDPE